MIMMMMMMMAADSNDAECTLQHVARSTLGDQRAFPVTAALVWNTYTTI